MSNSLENIHILLYKTDLKRLRRRAQTEKKSLAELIRQAIHKVYGGAEPDKLREAFKRLSERSELAVEDWELMKTDLLHRYE